MGLEWSIFFDGKRSGAQREILGKDEPRRYHVALGGKVAQEAAEGQDIDTARGI